MGRAAGRCFRSRSALPGVSIPSPQLVVRGALPDQDLVRKAQDGYAPTVVFVHRDAERVRWQERRREVPSGERIVPVIPVRMTEAWLLIDEMAIRSAAGNPNGTVALELPRAAQLESVPDPKEVLRRLLVEDSQLHGRRSRQFDRAAAVQRVANLIEDFTPLRSLEAFQAFERDLGSALEALGLLVAHSSGGG